MNPVVSIAHNGYRNWIK